MNIMKIVAVRDAAMGEYMSPFIVQNVGMAIRSFGDEVGKDDSPLNKHPEDYELFEIGEYDPSTAKIVSYEPKQLARATQYKGA